jgi:hypothetical protein
MPASAHIILQVNQPSHSDVEASFQKLVALVKAG